MSVEPTGETLDYPRWAHDELATLAERYGAPLIGFNRDAAAGAYLDRVNRKRRPGEVCMVVRRSSGRVLVARKDFYPPDAFRLLTGGIHRRESVLDALLRETEEETNLSVSVRRFLAVTRYQPPQAPEPSTYATFAFLLDEQGGTLKVNDPRERLEAFREVEPDDLDAIADQLDHLDDQTHNDDLGSSYHAWGRFRASTHRLVARALRAERG